MKNSAGLAYLGVWRIGVSSCLKYMTVACTILSTTWSKKKHCINSLSLLSTSNYLQCLIANISVKVHLTPN